MNIKEKYSKNAKLTSLSGAIVLFTDEKFEINNLNNFLNPSEKILIKKNLKNANAKKNIVSFDLNHNQKIILLILKKNIKNPNLENKGA